MNKNYYKMFPDKHFAFVKFQTQILSIKDAQLINFEYKSDNNYSKIEYLLIIISNCKPDFKSTNLVLLSDLYNSPLQTNNHKRVVWLVDSPIVTAFAHLFMSFTEGNFYCSTAKQAFTLLEIPIEFNDFQDMIKDYD